MQALADCALEYYASDGFGAGVVADRNNQASGESRKGLPRSGSRGRSSILESQISAA